MVVKMGELEDEYEDRYVGVLEWGGVGNKDGNGDGDGDSIGIRNGDSIVMETDTHGVEDEDRDADF